MRIGIGIGIGFQRYGGGARGPVLASQPPSLFWPINTAQNYDLAPHVIGVGTLSFSTEDTLPAGVSLASNGVLSGTATESVGGFIGVTVTDDNGSLLVPVYLAIQDVPDAFTVEMWELIPLDDALRISASDYPPDNFSAITSYQYRKDGGSPITLTVPVTDFAASAETDVEIRAINAIGAGDWSDLKTETPNVVAPDYIQWRERGTPQVSSSDVTSFTVNAHADREPGELLMVQVGMDGSTGTISAPGDWTERFEDQHVDGTTIIKAALYTKEADGTSADNLVLTSTAAEQWATKRWCSIGPADIAVGTRLNAAGGTSANPPSLTLPAEHDATWIAMVCHSGGGTAVSAGNAPTNYAYDGSIASTGTTSSHVRTHAASRELRATTEDAGAFSQAVTSPISWTVAVWKKAPVVVAPTVATPIADQELEQNTGGGTVSVAAAFTGTLPLSYSVSGGPSGTSVDASGLVSIPTGTAGSWTITVTAENSAGDADDSFGLTINAAPVAGAVFTPAYSVTENFGGGETATFSFVDGSGNPQQRLVAQSATGRWCVIGDAGNPVRVVLGRPSAAEAGVVSWHQSRAEYETRYRNGAMVNPPIIGRISYMDASAGAVNAQGFDNYVYASGMGTVYDAGLNANTGSPIVMTGGVLVQSIGLSFDNVSDITQTGGNTGFRTKQIGFASLSVVAEAPPVDFFAPAPGGADKTLTTGLHAGMIQWDLLRGDLDQTGLTGYRSLRVLAEAVQKMRSTWAQDRDRSRSMRGSDQRPSPYNVASVEQEYSRDDAKTYGDCLIAVHRIPTTGDDAAVYLEQLVVNLCQLGLDYVTYLQMGHDYDAGGGFQVGIKPVVAFTAMMLNLQWMKDLCDPARLRPSGTPLYRESGNPAMGSVGYGFAEHKRYHVVSSEMVELTTMYYPVAGRPYPLPYQPGHVGMPDWSEKGVKPSGEGWRLAPGWGTAYQENCCSDLGPVLGAHLVPGMSAVFRQDYILQYYDRAIVAKRAGKMRSEAGFSPHAMAAYDAYRDLTGVARVNCQPDQPDPPVVESFVGSGDRLGIRLSRSVFNCGSPITSWDIRYRTTTPHRFLTDEAGWTVVTGVSLSLTDLYFLTGLSSSTLYYVQIRAVNANGESAWSTNLRGTTSARTSAEGYGIPRATATTSTNQNVANTTPPFIAGGSQVGDEVVIDHGVWSIVPTSYNYQWKRNGTNISGATDRTYTRVTADAGTTLTCDVTGVNSSSSLLITTAGRAGIAASARSAPVVGATTRFDGANGASSTRYRQVSLGAALTHPDTIFTLFGFVTTKGGTIGAARSDMLNSSGTAVSSTSSGNAISDAGVTQTNGSVSAACRMYSTPSTSSGADRMQVDIGSGFIRNASAMAALRLNGYDLAAARYGAHREYVPSADVELYDEKFTGLVQIGVTRVINDGAETATGSAQIVPKGSLILGIMSGGPHYGAILPEWGEGMTAIDAATGYGGLNGPQGSVAIALGYQAETGPATITAYMGGNPVRFAMSVIAIPPA